MRKTWGKMVDSVVVGCGQALRLCTQWFLQQGDMLVSMVVYARLAAGFSLTIYDIFSLLSDKFSPISTPLITRTKYVNNFFSNYVGGLA